MEASRPSCRACRVSNVRLRIVLEEGRGTKAGHVEMCSTVESSEHYVGLGIFLSATLRQPACCRHTVALEVFIWAVEGNEGASDSEALEGDCLHPPNVATFESPVRHAGALR